VSRSTTKFARLDAIASKGKLGSVLIRLMMVINDMSLAMDAQRRECAEFSGPCRFSVLSR
jgi:hypothetical protein